MKREILLNNQKIDYRLRKSVRANSMRLTILPGGSFVVTAPYFLKFSHVEQFIRQKANWVLEKINLMKRIRPAGVFQKRSRKEYLRLKHAAFHFAQQKILEFNEIYHFKFNKISIRNQKSRWGSCSQKGNLNFNYKIILLPERYAEYIIVHELCHLGEFNHSKKFWKLVSRAVPDYKEIRKRIKAI